MMRQITTMISLVFGYTCLATVAVQVGLGAMLWSKDKLTRGKVVRYAAIAYGLDIADLPTKKPSVLYIDASDEELTHDQLLAKRVNANDILADRKKAMDKEAATIRSLEKELRAERDRRALVRSIFREFLNTKEEEVIVASLGDVQRTLESLSPRQAKDILLRMLADHGLNQGDNVLADVVTIIKAMPTGKRSKIMAEFKTDEEQEVLHQMVMESAALNKETQP